MKISAIIDCYNSKPFLAETVQSVLDQTRLPDELIIVDDGSTDGTADLARELVKGFEWARVIEKENGGQMSCLSRGVESSTGDIVAILDGDDLWFDHHLASAEEKFNEHKDLSLYYTSFQTFGEKEVFVDHAHAHGLIGRTSIVSVTSSAHIGGCNASLVAKSSAIKPYLPLPVDIERDWRINADRIVVWLTSLHGGDKYAEKEPGLHYRLHSNNATKTENNAKAPFFRKMSTMRFWSYARKVFYISDDAVILLAQEYKAHPNKSPQLKKQYLKAVWKQTHKVGYLKSLAIYLRISLTS